MKPENMAPLARTDDLAVQQVNDETLVYDKKTHHAHCLNRIAGVVWRHCDGRRTSDDLAKIVNQVLGLPGDPGLVELALQELGQAQLLEQYPKVTPEQKQYTRREVSSRLGVGAAAFLLAPLVTSIMTQSAMAAASPRPTTTVTTGTGTSTGTSTTASGSTTNTTTIGP